MCSQIKGTKRWKESTNILIKILKKEKLTLVIFDI